MPWMGGFICVAPQVWIWGLVGSRPRLHGGRLSEGTTGGESVPSRSVFMPWMGGFICVAPQVWIWGLVGSRPRLHGGRLSEGTTMVRGSVTSRSVFYAMDGGLHLCCTAGLDMGIW